MLARLSLFTLSALLAAAPGYAQELDTPEPVACSGVFGFESSEKLLIETFGADNVVTGQVNGPEGITYLATTVFPDDPQRRMEFSWFDESGLTQLSAVELAPTQAGPGGVQIGMSVAEVEAINAQPFTIGGFWWDYGGYAGFESGKLAGPLEGECYLSLRFSPAEETPVGVDLDAIAGEVIIPSGDPVLAQVDTRVVNMSLGYALDEPIAEEAAD